MNVITINFSDEDRKRLDRLADALEALLPGLGALAPKLVSTKLPAKEESDPLQQKLTDLLATAEDPMKAAEKPQEATKPETLATDHPADEEPPFETVELPKKAEPTVTRDDIRKKVIALSAAGKKNEVRDIVKSYADSVTTLAEGVLAKVFAELTALEG